MEKTKVLVVYTDTRGGVGFYRSTDPHHYINKKYGEEFQCDFEPQLNLDNLDRAKDYDIVHCHKLLDENSDKLMKWFEATKANGTKLVIDIDDHWILPETHPLYGDYTARHHDNVIKSCLASADYVTTTTPLFAEEIKPINPNVVVLPNAIDTEDVSFQTHKEESDKIRFGFVMGSAHENDVKKMGNFVSLLPKTVLDKIQIVLCGFDLRGGYYYKSPKTGKTEVIPVEPTKSVWHRYENMVTNGKKIVSEKHLKFLKMYIPYLEYPYYKDEHYRRCWTKDMQHYYSHFNGIDVLLVPLDTNPYNYVKSQLKCIECCFSNTGIVATNYGPYTIDLKSAIDKDGNIVKDGNALLVETSEGPEVWAKHIERIVENPELLKQLQENLHNDLKDKYSMEAVTKTRLDFYRSIAPKKETEETK